MTSPSRLRTALLRFKCVVVALLVGALVAGMARTTHAGQTAADVSFEEQSVEFHNQDVKLAGSLLLPKSDGPVPAVVFVHGAGRQTRESYREVGSFFARHGIAALIYDKRGVGDSSGMYESMEPYVNLINDALAAVAYLKEHPDIDSTHIGIWGLSQGAYISAAAASQSKDIQYVVVVGADVADGMLFYYRDNLFRRYGLSTKLRDMAEKLQVVEQDLSRIYQDGLRLSLFKPRVFPPSDQYLHPAWSHVSQPVLAMWGQLDQNVLVGESVAGLKNSLLKANNQKWTMIVLPGTNHDLKLSETGDIQTESHGYPPGALQTMTTWALNAIHHPEQIDNMKQDGVAPLAGILPRLASYQRLRFFSNGFVQAFLWMLFLISFSTAAIASFWSLLTRIFRRQQHSPDPTTKMAKSLKRAIGILNLVILVALTITLILVIDQMQPSCPAVLQFTPLLGTVSTLATFALLVVLLRTPCDHTWTTAKRLRFSFEVFCLILFVPFMYYWNLIGYRF